MVKPPLSRWAVKAAANLHDSPGRFLAVAEMKLIVISLLLHYDLKLISGTTPKSLYFGTSRIPDLRLPILMKAVS